MQYSFQRNKIRRIRQQHRLTQHEMGKRIGLARQHICAYEKGISVPSVPTLVKLMNAFELPPEVFFVQDNYSSNKVA